MRAQAIALATLIAAGCAATEPSQTVADSGGVICAREYPTGSSIPITKCKTAAQREQERRDTEADVQALRRGTGTSGRPAP